MPDKSFAPLMQRKSEQLFDEATNFMKFNEYLYQASHSVGNILQKTISSTKQAVFERPNDTSPIIVHGEFAQLPICELSIICHNSTNCSRRNAYNILKKRVPDKCFVHLMERQSKKIISEAQGGIEFNGKLHQDLHSATNISHRSYSSRQDQLQTKAKRPSFPIECDSQYPKPKLQTSSLIDEQLILSFLLVVMSWQIFYAQKHEIHVPYNREVFMIEAETKKKCACVSARKDFFQKIKKVWFEQFHVLRREFEKMSFVFKKNYSHRQKMDEILFEIYSIDQGI